MKTEHDYLRSFNERIKLFANFFTAISIGLIGFAVIRPLTESLDNADLSTLWWGIAGVALHGVSHYILGMMRREAKE